MRIVSVIALALLVFEARAADVRPAKAAEPEIHYAPVENLEHIDLALIRSATKSVDMAAFTLTDWPLIAVLKEARGRGVTVRILLDPSQRQADAKLAEMKDVVRVKKRGRPYMHLKAYAIDGVLLRTGSANFSPSGLKPHSPTSFPSSPPLIGTASRDARAKRRQAPSGPQPLGSGGPSRQCRSRGRPPHTFRGLGSAARPRRP